METIYKCKCGTYLEEDDLEYVRDCAETLLQPEEGHSACPMCGRDYEGMEELAVDQVLELLNSI